MKSTLRSGKLLLALGLTAAVFANEAKTAGIFPIATNANVLEFGYAVASDGTNYLVGLLSYPNVCAQLVSSNGTLVGSLVNVGSVGPNFKEGISLAFGRTNYLMVWSDNSLSSGVDIFGQFISPGGAKVDSAFPLLSSVGTHGFQQIECLAFDGTNFLVGWLDTSNRTIYIQFVTQTGALLGSEIATTPGPSLPAGTAALAFDGSNYLGVLQLKTSSSPEQWSTYGRFFSRNGSPGALFLISQTISTRYDLPNIAFDGTNYLVVWPRDIGPGYPDPEIWNVYGRLVTPAGTFLGDELPLATNQAHVASLAFDGSCYLLSWSYNVTTTNSDKTVWFQFFDRAANPIGSEFTLFAPQGTNSPLFGGAIYGGNQFLAVASLGFVGVDSHGSLTNFFSLDVYGTLIPKSTAAPRIDVAGPLAGAEFPLLLTGTPGINYAIEATTNLVSPTWTTLVTNSPTNSTFNFTDSHASNASRFYRAVKQ